MTQKPLFLSRLRCARGLIVFAWAIGWLAPPALFAADDLPAARKLFLQGKYAEAQEAYEKLPPEQHLTAVVGLARIHAAVGEYDQALQQLRSALDKSLTSATLHAEIAQLEFDRGRYAECDASIVAALKSEPEHLLARWLQAERHRTAGRLAEADQAYKWFVDYYNDHEVKEVESLRLIGLAAAQYARFHQLSDQFTFLVNELYPELIEADADYWPAHLEAGRLYLEKYNEAEARREFAAALKINGNSSEVYAAVAQLALQNYNLDEARRAAHRALEINPDQLTAHLALVDTQCANFEIRDALTALEIALKLNSVSEATLGRLAGVYAALDGLRSSGPVEGAAPTRFSKLLAEVDARNPHAGEFYYTLGATFDLARKYPLAARYYRVAVERMPQLVAPAGALGMVLMRLGEEAEARVQLQQSFDKDPFNARVSNSLKVLEVLDDYAVLETEHFVLRFDRGRDELLARRAAKYLEEHVYPELCKQFQFQPEGKSLFEFFSRSRNTNGHGWFSARMVGLPYVGTVGACAGKIVAMASPNDMPKKFNWARVLKHEFVHVLNLQQTDFNIPHWYTEALAVQTEAGPRSPVWNQLLRERVPKGDVFNLDTINLGFVRPKSSLDWQMAYCQAQLYAQYLIKTHGADAPAKLLQAYADNLDTRAALKRHFNIEQEAFEKGYRAFLDALVADLKKQDDEEDEPEPVEWAKRFEQNKDDPDAAAAMAEIMLAKKDYAAARKLADGVLQQQPKHPRANYVLSRVRLVIGEEDEAVKLLTRAFDPQKPDLRVLRALAEGHYQAGRYDEALKLYKLGAARQGNSAEWLKSLARVYIKQANEAGLTDVLRQLAEADADELVMRKKLAQLALKNNDFAQAWRWSNESLFIDVGDVDALRMSGQAAFGLKQYSDAIDSYEALVQLDGDDHDARFHLAEACVGAKQLDRARTVLQTLLERSSGHTEAQQLLKSLPK